MKSFVEVFFAFLKLGCTSFGGPVAHIGYFRRSFVERLGWISAKDFGEIVALAQFLPGPASSQTGFAIGVERAGAVGGLAAWLGFTAPSALLMLGWAALAGRYADAPGFIRLSHGLKLAAVAVVAQAVVAMARSLAPDPSRAAVAAAAGAIALGFRHPSTQMLGLALGAAVGAVAFPAARAEAAAPRPPAAALAYFALFAVFLAAAFFPAGRSLVGLFGVFYRAGALVFGGGHVVLPMLKDALVGGGWIGEGDFLSGYGAAQALPGPLFSVAAYYGASAAGIPGGLVAVVAIFLPGLLLMGAGLPLRAALRASRRGQGAIAGANAAVVGLLLAALYDPVIVGSVGGGRDAAIAAAGFLALVALRASPLAVVAFSAAAAAI